jgi:hypothetical protein
MAAPTLKKVAAAAAATNKAPAAATPATNKAPAAMDAAAAASLFKAINEHGSKLITAEKIRSSKDTEKEKLQQQIEQCNTAIKKALQDIHGSETSLTDMVKKHGRKTPGGPCSAAALQDIFKAHNLWPQDKDGKDIGINKLIESKDPAQQAIGRSFKSINTIAHRINKDEADNAVVSSNQQQQQQQPTNSSSPAAAPTPAAPTPAAASKPKGYDARDEALAALKQLSDDDLIDVIQQLAADVKKRQLIETALKDMKLKAA